MAGEYFGWGVIEEGWRKGPWTAEEDRQLIEYVKLHGEGRWNSVSRVAGTSCLYFISFITTMVLHYACSSEFVSHQSIRSNRGNCGVGGHQPLGTLNDFSYP